MDKFKIIGFTASDKVNRLVNYSFKTSRIIPIKLGDMRKYVKRKYNQDIYLKRENNRHVSENELKWIKARNGNLFGEIEKLFNVNWVKLKKIEVKDKPSHLQDMETTHGNYIANGIIVHNSPAAGAHIMVKDLDNFKESIIKYLSN